MFTYQRRVQFYESDLMGIVHHANYLRWLEEARVAWGHSHGFIKYDKPETASNFAVLETRVRHLKPARFGDEIFIDVEARTEGIRIFFQYRVRGAEGQVFCVAETDHVPLDQNLKPLKLAKEIRKKLEEFLWTETWLSNL